MATRNPILEELYAIRKKLLADAGGDVRKYLEGVRERERQSGRLVQPQPQRTNGCTGAADDVISDGEVSPAAQ